MAAGDGGEKGGENFKTNARPLVTPDELRRGSGQNIFAFMGDKPVVYFRKLPYYEIDAFKQDGKPRYDENPYFKT